MRISKICSYEHPYSVTGTIKQTGSKDKSKDICKDNTIGTWKTNYMENLNIDEMVIRKNITYFKIGERSATVPLKP